MKHFRADYNRIQDPEGLIPIDEPVFLLRAQDAFAPATLRFWAKKALDAKLYDIAQIIFKGADEMDEWQITHIKKLPDLKK